MNREYRQRISDEVKQIYFLDVERFDELFEDWRWRENTDTEGFGNIAWKIGREKSQISDFCAATRTPLERSLHVKPRPQLVDFIKSNMLPIDNDSIYFELTGRVDGILVAAKNNVILGSRWLALLPSSEYEAIRNRATLVLKETS